MDDSSPSESNAAQEVARPDCSCHNPPMNSSQPDAGILATLGWIDLTAIAVLLVFFVLGLFRGFVWQVSRIMTLVLAYVAAGMYGQNVADRIQSWFPANAHPQLPLYIAYFCVFLVVLVLVSLIAFFVEKLVNRTGLSFYNRMGGGMLGIATGACVVLAMLASIMMFLGSGSSVVQAAQSSRSMQVSKKALQVIQNVVPEPVLDVFGVAHSTTAKPAPHEQPRDPATEHNK